ncbi:MAG: conjugal transfer protein TraF [Alcanivoracaceae bacterium]
MRKTLLASAIAGTLISPLALADVYDARAMARGGTGMTMGEYNQAIYNPALINRFDDNDDFSFAGNIGVLASDKDGFIEGVEDVQDEIERLEDGAGATAADVDVLLQDLDGKLVQIEVGGALMVAIPNNTLPMAFISKGKASIGTSFSYDPSDFLILQAIEANTPGVDGEDLNSTIDASLLWIADYGLMLGKGFEVAGLQVDGGATVKIQTIELIAYSANAANFDAGDITDSNNLRSHTNLNVDLGVTTRLGDDGQYVLAGTIENLIPKTFGGPNASEYKMAPVLTVGAGYNGNWFKAEANLDLTQRNGYDLLLDTQFARVGVEISAGRHFHLRGGYRTDLKSNVSNVLTAGIGITPWDRFNIDLTGAIGEGDTYGVGLQLGFKI